MAVNFAQDLYAIAFEKFARPITVTPLVSQPGQPPYDIRGIFDSRETDILAEDGSIISDGKIILDILMAEFPILPMQGDRIDIAFHAGTEGGSFEVLDLSPCNAGGEITMTLRELRTSEPLYQELPL